MKSKRQSFAQSTNGSRHSWRVLCILCLLLSTLLPIGLASKPLSAQAQKTYWLGRLVGTEYVFDTPLPDDFAAMVTANGSKYSAFKDLPKSTTQVIDGKSYSFVSISLAWDNNLIDNGQIAFRRNGAVGQGSWFTMDKSSAEWPAVTTQLKAQATVNGTWKYVDLQVLISTDAETPTVRLSIFGAQERYWFGRVVGTEYVFDTPLPPDFATKIIAADPNQYVIDKTPRAFTQLVNGTKYSLVKTEITYDKPQYEKGEVALVRKKATTAMLWLDGKLNSVVGEPLAEQLPAPKQGEWKSVEMVILVSPNAETPTLRAPVPKTTLAKIKMNELGAQTSAGLYYSKVKIPTNLDAFRAQMLAYGNAGRQDPYFRQDNGSQTATDLSQDMVQTDIYENGKKTGRTQMEKVFRQSETPPYFADHVLNDKLNDAAQFQAEYQASVNRLGHDGPRSYLDPKSGKNVNLFDLGQRADFFGVVSVVEAAGQGGLGNYPHSWMVGETHFRPWFNVYGCYPEIGYGAAMASDGTWYFVAVPRIDTECLDPGPAAKPNPATTSTSTGTTAANKPAYYVDIDAKGKTSGLSWKDAFPNVQDALAAAKSGDQIWVAEGVYYPDEGKGQENNDRSAHFSIPAGVALYGGFAGTETALEQRDLDKHATVLSGDIDQNDKRNAAGVTASALDIKGANSFHVVYLDGTAETGAAVTDATIIDGFVITAGLANSEEFPDHSGAGLFCSGLNEGGQCSPTLMNVTFIGNQADGNGGAMFNDGRFGGASSPTLTNVIFSGNSGWYGGALYNYGGTAGVSSPSLTNVVFSGNFAKRWGGAILNQGEGNGNSSPSLINVTFSGNMAEEMGGAIFNFGRGGKSSPTLTNVILWNNDAPQGPSIYNLDNATALIQYSIVQNGAKSIAGAAASLDATNINKPPIFVEPLAASKAPTSEADLRLKQGSPAIDAGLDGAVPATVTTDLAGNKRKVGGKVDIGAYEFLKP